jgi:hypothetical protein
MNISFTGIELSHGTTRITTDRHGLNLAKSAMGTKIKQTLTGTLSVSIRGGSVSIRVWITFSLFWVFPKNMRDCGGNACLEVVQLSDGGSVFKCPQQGVKR